MFQLVAFARGVQRVIKSLKFILYISQYYPLHFLFNLYFVWLTSLATPSYLFIIILLHHAMNIKLEFYNASEDNTKAQLSKQNIYFVYGFQSIGGKATTLKLFS